MKKDIDYIIWCNSDSAFRVVADKLNVYHMYHQVCRMWEPHPLYYNYCFISRD